MKVLFTMGKRSAHRFKFVLSYSCHVFHVEHRSLSILSATVHVWIYLQRILAMCRLSCIDDGDGGDVCRAVG